jgi:hypothetical protein
LYYLFYSNIYFNSGKYWKIAFPPGGRKNYQLMSFGRKKRGVRKKAKSKRNRKGKKCGKRKEK